MEVPMAIELERPTLTLEEFMALQEPKGGHVRGYEYEDGRLIPMPNKPSMIKSNRSRVS